MCVNLGNIENRILSVGKIFTKLRSQFAFFKKPQTLFFSMRTRLIGATFDVIRISKKAEVTIKKDEISFNFLVGSSTLQ